jgi:hypothetical protein
MWMNVISYSIRSYIITDMKIVRWVITIITLAHDMSIPVNLFAIIVDHMLL